jgi:hypothetical protein
LTTPHIPAFLIPGLTRTPQPLGELLREVGSKYGKHPLSAILQRVERPTGGEWARKMIEGAEKNQLRPLYEFLIQSEYAQEMVNGLTAEPLKELEKSVGEMSNEILASGYFARDLIGKTEQTKISGRIRKRVSAWFKSVNRWPIL